MAVSVLELGPEGSLALLPCRSGSLPHPYWWDCRDVSSAAFCKLCTVRTSLQQQGHPRSSVWPNWNVRASLLLKADLGWLIFARSFISTLMRKLFLPFPPAHSYVSESVPCLIHQACKPTPPGCPESLLPRTIADLWSARPASLVTQWMFFSILSLCLPEALGSKGDEEMG